MIFPTLPRVRLSEAVDYYPWTLTLVFLNLFIFFVLQDAAPEKTSKNERITIREALQQQEDYEVFLQQSARFFLEWQGRSQLTISEHERSKLARSALGSRSFFEAVKSWKSNIDPVGFEKWKIEYGELKNEAENDPARIFGLSHQNKNSLAWVTYQFVQYDVMHLLSNVISLLLFAVLVESLVGGVLTGVVYLLGGFVGGAVHLWMGPDSGLPLVGSSAAVAALIAFAAVGTLRKRIPYITIVNVYGLMMRGHPQSQRWMESLYLSPLWLLSYYLLNDVGTVISTPAEWSGSVAHWAHVGGGAVGILLGLAFKFGVKRSLHPASLFDGGKPSA